MRITWGSAITAGITASVAIVLFTFLISKFLGLAAIDITRDLGAAFSAKSPYLVGSMVLAFLGVFWAALFALLYHRIPGNAVSKGMVYGLIVGVLSLSVLPKVLVTMNTIVGASTPYLATPFSFNQQTIITLVAYMVFGITLAWSYRPAEMRD